MESLWAPWRMDYIVSDKSKECVFCTAPKAENDSIKKILFRGPNSYVILNIFPYANGHLMICPYRHVGCITLLNDEEFHEMSVLTKKSLGILRQEYRPDGFNTGYNIGKSAGAGFEEHLHGHIVPRWNGDTNFMPVLAETKVHPEHIEATYNRLVPIFRNITL
ncbi:MAG: HIT domain-containing protein [Nitrospina sp.]|nr:MAG: HIT domain-containing protein [Nitrospina sp.]